MKHTDMPAAAASDACERLAQTRQELLRHMQQARGDTDPAAAGRSTAQEPHENGLQSAHDFEPPGRATDDGSAWQHLRHSLGAWWHTHPAHLAVEVAQPVLEKYARAHPLKVLGVCAATGAVLVLARPWRLISITGLLVAALKSTQMSALAAAALRSAFSPPGPGTRSPHRPPERTHP